jgi:hypothetical protein
MYMALPSLFVRLTIVAALVVACLTAAAAPAAAAERSGQRPLSTDGQRSKAKSQRGQHRHGKKRHKARARRAGRTSRRLNRVNRRSSLRNAVAVGTARPRSSSSSTGDLLFDGSHLGDFAQIQAAPDAVREVSDPLGSGAPGFEITVDESDVYPVTPTENPRAQALSPSLIDPGEEFWLRTRFMLPANFPEVDGWMCLSQIYGPPFDGSSPWQIGIRGDELMWQRNGTYDYDIAWQMPLPRERWVDVLVHQRFAGDGWVEMWIDGRQVTFFESSSHNPNRVAPTQRLEMATIDSSNAGGPNHAKVMQYRQAGLFDSATLYFGSLLLGKTRASVGA